MKKLWWALGIAGAAVAAWLTIRAVNDASTEEQAQ